MIATGALVFLCLVTSAADVPEFGADVTVGQVPPPLVLDKLLQAGAPGLTLQSVLAGPSVVEFWATWCEPCVEQIPHLNALHQAMEGRALNFLAVTSEEEDKVTAFLAAHPMRGTVGLEGKSARNWGIHMLPTTVLLDAKGRVAAVMHPRQLNPRLLQRLLNGEPLDADPLPEKSRNEDAMLRVAVWQAAPDDDEDFDISEHHLRARRAPLKALLAFAYGVQPWQVQLGKGVVDGIYHVSISVPSDKTGETVAQLTREALIHALHLRITRSQQTLPVTVLMRSKKTVAPVSGSASGRSMDFHPGSPDMLLDTVRPLFKTPLVDESGLKVLDLTLHDVADVAVVRRDVQAQLGLEFKSGKRKLDMVRVEHQ